MKTSFLLVVLLAATQSTIASSWFGSNDPSTLAEYASWSESQLQEWLNDHNIRVPEGYSRDQLADLVQSNWDATTAWTNEQLEAAHKKYQGLKENAFDAWDESRLHEFLLEQGVIAPKGPKEQLVLSAKNLYRSYASALSSYSSRASASASTAVYGDRTYQASKSLSSLAHSASETATKKLNDATDYVYSTWSDSELRGYLEKNGYVKSQAQLSREEMLKKMKAAYADTTSPVWKAWSDSYMHNWLVDQGIVKSDYEKKRDKLTGLLQYYYYGAQDTVWNTWTDSDLKAWLVEHDIIRSDAQIKRDKMLKLVGDNYVSARDTVWQGWKDSEIRDWLIEHGYLRSDAQLKRDELVKLIDDKYQDSKAKAADYLVWPDARLRAYLRRQGLDDAQIMPSGRPNLLHEVRIRYVQTTNRIESLLAAIKDAISNGVESAEEKLSAVYESLTGAKHDAATWTEKKKDQVKEEL